MKITFSKRSYLKSIYIFFIVICLQQPAIAEEELIADVGYFQEVAHKTRLLGFKNIFSKWQELKGSLLEARSKGYSGEIFNQLENYIEDDKGADLKIFISRSMGHELIKRYVLEAKKYGGVLVLRGLPDDSWQSLSSLVLSLADITGIDNLEDLGLTIDDESFSNYGIQSVPSFVLSKKILDLELLDGKNNLGHIVYDKVSGNIGVRRALESIVDSGELADLATELLIGQR